MLQFILPNGHERADDKLNAIAYGFFIPIFFVESGMKIDLAAVEAGALTQAGASLMISGAAISVFPTPCSRRSSPSQNALNWNPPNPNPGIRRNDGKSGPGTIRPDSGAIGLSEQV